MSRSATNQSPAKPIAQPPIIVPLNKGDLGGSNPEIPPTPLVRGSRTRREGRSLGLDSFEFETCQLSSEGVVIQRQTKTAPYFRQDLGNGVFVDMVVIPGGQFRNIQIPEFCMAKTLITQAQWEAVAKLPKVKIELKSNPSYFKGSNRPVERVNWWMAEEFCKRLAIVTKRDYRLPAEAQWEYACRSGTTTNYYFGDTLSAEVANYGNSIKETTEVGKYPANAWGLYDMHGNLWEWCADHWSDKFKTALKDSNPIVSGNEKFIRVLRGGSWLYHHWRGASDFRHCSPPETDGFGFIGGVGLRVVCSAPRTWH